jgi:SulP family sulfate permease
MHFSLGVWWRARKETLREDIVAGLIVAVVALPLAIGFAIASDVPPAMGVTTAIVAGFFAALFGGSSYQISGPTGAMVVVILSVVHAHGVSGLVAATLLAGAMLILMGIFRLGKIIEYIPSPVIVGFTAGIATIIFFGQVGNALGVAPTHTADASFVERTVATLALAPDASMPAIILLAITVAVLVLMPRLSRRIPGGIVAVAVATALVMLFPTFFHVGTVADVGEIPRSLPMPQLPHIDLAMLRSLLPAALTIAALAAIESLLSAVVADSLTDTRHKPNRELVGQGIANVMSSLFGGMPATGAIARTATNVRNGGRSNLAAVFHAFFLLLLVLVAAPLAVRIPLAALAGILMFVAFNMVEWERVLLIFRTPLSDVAVMLTTFLLTVFVDLTVAIEVGLVLAALLFMKRMSDLYHIESLEHRQGAGGQVLAHPDISIYTVQGPLFFGAASRFDQAVANAPGGHKPIKIIRMKHVPVIDATGLNFLESTVHKHRKRGGAVLFAAVHPNVLRVIRDAGLGEKLGREHFFPTTRAALAHALRLAHRRRNQSETVTAQELARYDLSQFDAEELGAMRTTDTDPVREALDSLGVTYVADIGQRTLKAGSKTIRRTIKSTMHDTKEMRKRSFLLGVRKPARHRTRR